MSRILLIEPHRMLQQAFVAALFPDHEVQVFDKTPEAASIRAADLLVIDAAALAKLDGWPSAGFEAFEDCDGPVLWIGGGAPPDKAAGMKIHRLEPPLKRDALRAAVAECLRSPGGPEEVLKTRQAAGKSKLVKQPKQEKIVPAGEQRFIELVDVFEETPASPAAGAGPSGKD